MAGVLEQKELSQGREEKTSRRGAADAEGAEVVVSNRIAFFLILLITKI
jgi:hypothetical protein